MNKNKKNHTKQIFVFSTRGWEWQVSRFKGFVEGLGLFFVGFWKHLLYNLLYLCKEDSCYIDKKKLEKIFNIGDIFLVPSQNITFENAVDKCKHLRGKIAYPTSKRHYALIKKEIDKNIKDKKLQKYYWVDSKLKPKSEELTILLQNASVSSSNNDCTAMSDLFGVSIFFYS